MSILAKAAVQVSEALRVGFDGADRPIAGAVPGHEEAARALRMEEVVLAARRERERLIQSLAILEAWLMAAAAAARTEDRRVALAGRGALRAIERAGRGTS